LTCRLVVACAAYDALIIVSHYITVHRRRRHRPWWGKKDSQIVPDLNPAILWIMNFDGHQVHRGPTDHPPSRFRDFVLGWINPGLLQWRCPK